MVVLGNMQINGSAAQNNPAITCDTFTDTGSLKYARPGTVRILEQFGFGNWSESYIRSRFALAEKYASQVDGLILLLQEEVYKPSRTPQTSATTLQGGYSIEGVNIPSSNEDAYFLALLTAWKKLCVRLGKKACICGSLAVCSDDGVWAWMYGSLGVSYIAQNYDMIYLYHYPQTVAVAQGATCTQMNGNPGKNDAASYIKFWRGRGFNGLINYILTGSTDFNVIRADFKSAVDAGADIISTYPYANGVYSNSDAVGRMLQIAAEYGGMQPPTTPPPTPGGNMTTILVLGDPHMGEASNRVAELTKDLNAAVSLSPTGQIDCILCTGDLEGVAKFDQAHKASMLSSKPALIIPGNHDVGSIADIKKFQGTGYPLHPGPAGTEKTSFSFDVGDIHITMLNLYWDGKTNEGYTGGGKSGGEVGSTLLAWLKADLAAATTKYKIVCAHEPMYPDKRHKGDSLDWNIAARDALQKVLQDAGVDAFFAGHTHYARGDLIGGSVLQIQDGVPGSKAGTTGDPYRSMWFVHIAANGDLVITWKHNANSGSSWTSPVVQTWVLPQGSTPTPQPQPGGTITVSTSAQLQAALEIGGNITINNGSYNINPVTSPAGTIATGESKTGVIINCSSTGYFITLKSGSIIQNCTIRHKGKTIFVSGNQKNWKVLNCHFIDSVIAVLAEDLTSGYPTAGEGAEVAGNTGINSKLMTMQGQYKLHVHDNEFRDRNGSEFFDMNYNNNYCVVENNKLINSTGYTMSEEMFDMVGGNGQPQDNNIIRNNIIIGNFQSGIRPGITTKNNTIEDNYIEWISGQQSQEAGIYMYGKGGSSVPTGNKIIGNTIKGGNCGIKLSNADNNRIEENTIKNAVRGIALVRDSIYGADIAPNGNTVSRNTIVVSNLQNGIINEGQNIITPDNVITDTELPPPQPGPGPVEFDLSNLAKVSLALITIYNFIEGLRKK